MGKVYTNVIYVNYSETMETVIFEQKIGNRQMACLDRLIGYKILSWDLKFEI